MVTLEQWKEKLLDILDDVFYRKSEIDTQNATLNDQISHKENRLNKVTSLSDSSTDIQYPSAKAVYDAINAMPNSGFIEITDDKGMASASTMGKLYIETINNETAVYYTEKNDDSYSWHELNDNLFGNLTVHWHNIKDKPDIFQITVIDNEEEIVDDGLYLLSND